MNCPACGTDLMPLKIGTLVVDVCAEGCGGIWFDNFELSQVNEACDPLGERLAALTFNPLAQIIPDKRPCPKCTGFIMRQHKFSPDKPIIIDECPNCGGVWLDGGELAEIRRVTPTAADRRKATQKFFNDLVAMDLAALRTRRQPPA